MKFLELFAGIGGFRVGLENTGHECVWASEWLEKPRRIYKKQFGDMPYEHDIRTVTDRVQLPEADFLTAGFPCATFSVAGKRSGFGIEDTRGTLAFETVRIIRLSGVRYFILENVKGLVNHDNGRTFATLLGCIDELGFDCQWEVCNSKHHGVPQNRERIFVVGHRRGEPRPKIFPIGDHNLKADQEKVVVRSAKTRKDYERKLTKWRSEFFKHDHHAHKRKEIPELIYRDNRIQALEPGIDLNDDDLKHYMFDNRTRYGNRFCTLNDVSPCLMGAQAASDLPYLIDGQNVRKFTPLECERIQGLPDNFTKYYDDDTLVSDNERYERIGRTVSIPIIEAMGRRLGTEYYE
jgi:DNA (cytosine-5)-methyltransferase 1